MPAPTWVADPGGFSFGWVADCGEYLGTDWPPVPATTLYPGGDTTSDQIFIYIAVPDPTVFVFDGSEPLAYSSLTDTNDNPSSPALVPNSGVIFGTLGSETSPLHVFVCVARYPGYDATAPAPEPPFDATTVVPAGYLTPLPTPPPPPDWVITAELFDTDGVTSLGALETARNIHWTDPQNGRGAGGLSVLMADALTASIGENSIIKCSIFGETPFGIVVKSDERAVDGNEWLTLDNQPGLLSLLDEGYILPEYGITTTGLRTGDQIRNIGWMSTDFGWLVSGDWSTPGAVSYATDTARPLPAPPSIFASNNPDWIAVAPDTSVAAGTVQYLRADLAIASGGATPTGIFTADNFLDLYVAGKNEITSEQSKANSWTQAYTAPLTLDAGTYVVAAQIENAWHASGANPMALMGLVADVDHNGQPTGTPYLKTNAADWLVYTGSSFPGPRRAAILKQLFDESVAATHRGPSLLTLGFDATNDSNGDPWDDVPKPFAFQVGQSLGEVALALCESVMDLWVDPVTMTLHAYKRRSTDESATKKLKLGKDGGGLKSWRTSRAYATRTVLMGQLSTGRLIQVEDSAGIAASGRICAFVNLGDVSDVGTATEIMQAILASSVNPPVTITGADASILVGVVPYKDAPVGATLEGPGHRGSSPLKFRAMEATVDGSVEPPRVFWSSLVEDRSV
jgi:hypothetical protein